MELSSVYQLIGEKTVGEASANKTVLRLYGKVDSVDERSRTALISFKAVLFITKGSITFGSWNGHFNGDYDDAFTSRQTSFSVGETQIGLIEVQGNYEDDGTPEPINIGAYFRDSYYNHATTLDNVVVTYPAIRPKTNIQVKHNGVIKNSEAFVKMNGTLHRVSAAYVKVNGVLKQNV